MVLVCVEDRGPGVPGRSLIGRATRDALLDEPREPRSGRHDAVSPFEWLTRREQQVLGALIQGASADEIVEAHVVALCTIGALSRAILHKLGVRSQPAVVTQANRAGGGRRQSGRGSSAPGQAGVVTTTLWGVTEP